MKKLPMDQFLLNTGVGLASFPSASTDCVKAKWTSAMDQYFLELMLDQIRKGNKTDNTFSKQAWKDMLTLFNAKFCSQFGKYVLKRRYRKLFQYYSDMKSLLERKGFSWDGKHHKIVAEAGVWNRYIKVYVNPIGLLIYSFMFVLTTVGVGAP